MRVLVAEDDRISRNILVKTLRSLGHEVIECEDGTSALESYKKSPAPVVITDWEMPGLDGLELTRRIRRSHAKIYSYIILLTAADYEENMLHAIEQGVDDFLEKPMPLTQLKARLKVGERHAMVASMTSALPICMMCKAVRDDNESWVRIEEYFGKTSGIDFSHGYCPDCYYDESLRPELTRWRNQTTVRPPAEGFLVDSEYFDRLMGFDERDSPGLVADLIDGFIDGAPRAKRDLERYNPARPSARLGGRLRHFSSRCRDLGASGLAEGIDAVLATQAAGPETPLASAKLDSTVERLTALRPS